MFVSLFSRIIEKLFVIFNVTKIYESKVGIKIINSFLKNYNFNKLNSIILDKNMIYLGFDALIDKYSLCDISLVDSPHYYFMKALYDNENIKNTDYYYRYYHGILDGRRKRKINEDDIKHFNNMFNLRLEEIESGNYKPVQVYKIKKKYYIADGKHRAALCALCNKKIKCVEISTDFLLDSTRMKIYSMMKKSKNNYKKNIKLFESVIYDDNN